MDRRKFVIGMGALASGSAAAMGTGAFSQATVSGRQVSVEIAETDESGGLGLIPGQTDIARMDGNGNLDIDLDEGLGTGASGMNPNSTYYLGGELDSGGYYEKGITKETLENVGSESGDVQKVFDRPLFSVRNQSTELRRLAVEAEAVKLPDGASVTAIAWQYGGVDTQAKMITLDNEGDTGSGQNMNVNPGHQQDFIMILDSGSASGEILVEFTFYAQAIRPEETTE